MLIIMITRFFFLTILSLSCSHAHWVCPYVSIYLSHFLDFFYIGIIFYVDTCIYFLFACSSLYFSHFTSVDMTPRFVDPLHTYILLINVYIFVSLSIVIIYMCFIQNMRYYKMPANSVLSLFTYFSLQVHC